MRRFIFGFGLVLPCLMAALPPAASAQGAYPTKPIRVVVTAQAGGASDFVGRLIGEHASKSLGQAFVIDNRAGANGAVGLGEVARAAPDGYTIAVTLGDSLINNVALYKTLPYDPQRDFVFVTQVVRSPAILSANLQLGVKNMDEFKKLAARPNQQLSYGTWGPGGLGHLAGEALNRKLDAGMVHVPQRGEAPVMADLLSNTVSVGLTSAGLARQHVQAGKIVPLAIMGRERSPVLPEVPTMRELGFEDPLFEAAVWIAFVAPAKTPPQAIERLTAALRAAAALPEVQARMAERGLETLNTTPEQFNTGYKRDFDVITRRMKEFGIEAQ
ncbi:putative Bug-like extra-cytoplasmic solute receptor, TTT family [Burkholderiales bacterium 8X]|nr:putative Bug-like extra-cytoplasmic solute receptor, TTT family [Burkholderiales bacterium 8X]